MTKDTLSETAALRALLSETPDRHVQTEMLRFVADRLMALDVEQLCGAGLHERSTERANHRNGYRARAWNTRAGTVDVQIPKLRKGTYIPEFLEPRRVAENANGPTFGSLLPTSRSAGPGEIVSVTMIVEGAFPGNCLAITCRAVG